ncbi:MAG: carnitine 3-dehydrogenase [Pseudotabrizicola sp.]|uniref:carnitine 3-dehydrogenase n=1 Tax=Pseudotabrizicola sp. TaxID=2939647 RepID=UPI0027221F0A|nr:carnitine 3-dehydrogenase [Pseudotabrizicola sp.]MDO8885027.1 carnitine 3-dehydrogenase [Pseudotabrizicola sp.]MDP2080031.1 carnitine 3-dehydrogenase [Pseudotabrizicola sp.]MDZ7575477.1 carnitine 3-dehydrogenase [Pseudotabrizicola sp.]
MTRKAAIIGGGVIGGGWAARFLLNGWDVAVFDPDPEAPRKVGEVLANARAALPALSDGPMPVEGRLVFAETITEAVEGADYIQESVSERLELKHRVFAQIQQVAPDVPIGSSTSGFKPSQLQQNAANPAVIFVAHPFNPVYLLPLAEVVPSPSSDPALIEAVKETLREIGMFPLHIRKEIDAHIADRFLEAVWREALWLVKDGIATTEEIDEAIRMGFGLRWGQMGLFETYRVAGGEAGMKHFMAQFGPCLQWPWTKLTDVPEFNDELVDLIAGQSDAQSGMHTIRELERIRDQNLIGFLRVLKERNWGAGKVLLDHDARRRTASPAPVVGEGPMETARMTVLPGWIDYNGHMTESRYLFAASETSDAFLRQIGADIAYVGTGFSYYTAETHIMHLGEAKLGDALRGTVQVLAADEKRLHIFIRILKDGETVATLEQMLLHVDTARGKTCAAPQVILDRLLPIATTHAALPRPDASGRHVGQRKA